LRKHRPSLTSSSPSRPTCRPRRMPGSRCRSTF
jgi:hypothetical protein